MDLMSCNGMFDEAHFEGVQAILRSGLTQRGDHKLLERAGDSLAVASSQPQRDLLRCLSRLSGRPHTLRRHRGPLVRLDSSRFHGCAAQFPRTREALRRAAIRTPA